MSDRSKLADYIRGSIWVVLCTCQTCSLLPCPKHGDLSRMLPRKPRYP